MYKLFQLQPLGNEPGMIPKLSDRLQYLESVFV